MSEISDQISSIWVEAKETFKLNVEYAKLTATEKVTVLMSMVAIALICLIICTIILFLISLGLMLLLAKSTGLFGACMIMAGIYAVLLVVVILLRKQLLYDHVARFVSHLFLK